MKRGTYSIPTITLLGLGCGDPITSEWQLTLLANEAMVDPREGVFGCSAYGESATMEVDNDLSVKVIVTYEYGCFPISYIEDTLLGSVEIVAERSQYTITLNQGNLILDCALNGRRELSCTDNNGALWEMER